MAAGTRESSRLITVFTPSWADEDNTNAQNLTVKEIVARLPEDRFHVGMICGSKPDARIALRKNTRLFRNLKHGNTVRLLRSLVFSRPDIYFFPRLGPLDHMFFNLKRYTPLRTKLLTYIVMEMNERTGAGLIQRAVGEADWVFANSIHVAESVKQRFGREAEVVYDGVDHGLFFPPKDREDRAIVVLYAGSFQARKRVESIIEQAIRHPHVEFRLAGKGETERECRALSERRGCGNVKFLGHLSHAELGTEMRASDVFLFPSVLEGHPQVLIQAAACGLPCVAMGVYRPDYVVDGESGFLVRSDQELSERLDLLLANRDVRLAMSAAAERHSWRFDWDRIAEQWASIFERASAGIAKQ